MVDEDDDFDWSETEKELLELVEEDEEDDIFEEEDNMECNLELVEYDTGGKQFRLLGLDERVIYLTRTDLMDIFIARKRGDLKSNKDFFIINDRLRLYTEDRSFYLENTNTRGRIKVNWDFLDSFCEEASCFFGGVGPDTAPYLFEDSFLVFGCLASNEYYDKEKDGNYVIFISNNVKLIVTRESKIVKQYISSRGIKRKDRIEDRDWDFYQLKNRASDTYKISLFSYNAFSSNEELFVIIVGKEEGSNTEERALLTSKLKRTIKYVHL